MKILFEIMSVVVRKNRDTNRESIDINSFEATPERAVQKSNRAAKVKGDDWIFDNPISRIIEVFIKELKPCGVRRKKK